MEHPMFQTIMQRQLNRSRGISQVSSREALKQRNRHMISEWIAKHGDTNQKERLAVGLLPWDEAYEAIDVHYFKQLSNLIGGMCDENTLPTYRRFVIEDICECESLLGRLCKPQFLTAAVTELSAQEWNNLSHIKAALAALYSTATWTTEIHTVTLLEHRAKCLSVKVPLICRTALVTLWPDPLNTHDVSDGLSFHREFALTQ